MFPLSGSRRMFYDVRLGHVSETSLPVKGAHPEKNTKKIRLWVPIANGKCPKFKRRPSKENNEMKCGWERGV